MRRPLRVRLLVAPFVFTTTLAASGVARADAPYVETGRAAADAVAAPVAAVARAAEDDAALRKLGDLAVGRSKEARVRQLGAVVRNDAREADGALERLARKMDIRLPRDLSPDASARASDLEKRRPDQSFDRALVDEMLRQERDASGALEHVTGDVAADERGLLNQAALSLREAERATAIERKPMKDSASR